MSATASLVMRGHGERQRLRHGRTHLRVPTDLEAWAAWGYRRVRCRVLEFSTHGLSVRGIDAPLGTPLSVSLPLPRGSYTICGVVVHSAGVAGSSGVRLLPLPVDGQFDLECFLWDLLAPVKDARLCAEVGCDRPKKARGLCSLHYNRWRRRELAR